MCESPCREFNIKVHTMSKMLYKPEELQLLRTLGPAVKRDFEERFEEAVVQGDPTAIEALFREASLGTNAYENMREKLGDAGVMLAKYGVHVINDCTILFVLPAGCSRIEVLKEVQRVVGERDEISLIQPKVLEKWESDEGFLQTIPGSKRVCIHGHVRGSNVEPLALQQQFIRTKNVKLPSVEDLATAFALHWVATMSPLFGWYRDSTGTEYRHTYAARAKGSDALVFGSDGLYEATIMTEYLRDYFSVAALVSPRRK